MTTELRRPRLSARARALAGRCVASLALFLLAPLATTPLAAQSPAAALAALDGRWVLDTTPLARGSARLGRGDRERGDETGGEDDARTAGPGGGRDMGPGGGGWGPGGGRGMGSGGFGGRGMGGRGMGRGAPPPGGAMAGREPPAGMRDLLRELRPASELRLTVQDTAVVFEDGPLEARSYPFTGSVREPASDADDVFIETRTRVKDRTLEVERKVGKAGTIRRRYLIEPVTKQLVVITEVDGLPGPRREPRRFVYDRAP